ncbi:MAG: hypothetical protein ACI8TP_000160 [Acidimicrobiales bacterium]|jgi:hypothetical protein
MKTWTEVFRVETDAIVGSPEVYRRLETDLVAQHDRLVDVVDRIGSAVTTQPGFEGMAAQAFADLTAETARQLESTPLAIAAVADALGSHAEELEDLLIRSDRELQAANDHYEEAKRLRRTVADLKAELAIGGESNVATSIDLYFAEQRQQDADDAIDRSRRAYDQLRSDEDDLSGRTAALLRRHPLPPFEPFRLVVGAALGATFDGVDLTWSVIRNVMLEAGIDVAFPAGAAVWAERPEGTIWTDGDGQPHVMVGGPYGGDYRVGSDIGSDLSPGVYEAVAALLTGVIPASRSWSSLDDLTDSELHALNWAFGSNFVMGQSGQLQVSGVNGAWQNFVEGGDYTPQRLWPTDGLRLAMGSGVPSGVGAQGFVSAMGSVALGAIVNDARERERSTKRDQPLPPRVEIGAAG